MVKARPHLFLMLYGAHAVPIDVKNATPSDLRVLKIDYLDVPLNIIDNGHAIQANHSPGSTLAVGDETYSLKQFHFHHPAEERIMVEASRWMLIWSTRTPRNT
jgi:carbonic anhydrase